MSAIDQPYTEVIVETHGHVDVITIDRPEARNALTYTTYAELQRAVETSTARSSGLDEVKATRAVFPSEPAVVWTHHKASSLTTLFANA